MSALRIVGTAAVVFGVLSLAFFAAQAAAQEMQGVGVYRCQSISKATGAVVVSYGNHRCPPDAIQSQPWLAQGVIELRTREYEAAMRGGNVPTTGDQPKYAIARGGK